MEKHRFEASLEGLLGLSGQETLRGGGAPTNQSWLYFLPSRAKILMATQWSPLGRPVEPTVPPAFPGQPHPVCAASPDPTRLVFHFPPEGS